jgi:integrase
MPVCRKVMYGDFHRALRNIGISYDGTGERHLHLHTWRYFFDTELLKEGLTIPQTQAVTGDKPEQMTE